LDDRDWEAEMGDEDIDRRNRESVERGRAIADRLSSDDLRRPIDPPWTPAALFAHMAFWDRFAHTRWTHAIEAGSLEPVGIDEDALELLNHAELGHWLDVPADLAVREFLEAAESINRLVASLDDEVLRRTTETRPRLVDRSLHRGEHLDTMESG
jgi:hypothetical protein